MADTNTYMGVYLKLLDQSQYFTTEPITSNFPVVSTLRLQKGQVGVPIEFTQNNLVNILKTVGLPLKGKNDKEWWSFYKAFQYSKPVTVFRVINDSTFKNAGIVGETSTGTMNVDYETVDEQTIQVPVSSSVVDTSTNNLLIKNEDISNLILDGEGFLSGEFVKVFLKSPGVNPDNLDVYIVNAQTLEDNSQTISSYEYDAVAEGSLVIRDGIIDSVSISSGGSGYTNGETVTINGSGTEGEGEVTTEDGVVSSLSFNGVGTGYSVSDTITIVGTSSGESSATATVDSVSGGAITAATITDGGSGYTDGESFSVTGGSGSGETGTLSADNGVITSVTVTDYGQNYVDSESVTLSGTGSGATGTVSTLDGIIHDVTISEAGSGYTSTNLSYEITTSTGSGAVLDIVLSTGSISDITITNKGSGYTSSDTIDFKVTETLSLDPYADFKFIDDAFDFTFTADKLAMLVYVDGVLEEKFYFDGNSTSDYYWGNIDSNYVYIKCDDDVLNDTSTGGFQSTPYGFIYNFQNKGEGEMEDVTFTDYLTTLDFIPNSGIENALYIDGGITSGTKLGSTPTEISQSEAKQYQIKLVTSVAEPTASLAVLSFPQSLEKTLVGKADISTSDLSVYVDYKNGLGLNGTNGYDGAIYAPSSQKIFDIFNNQWIWISNSVDEAASLAALQSNFHYSNVEAIRGTLGIEKLIIDIKLKSLEGYLYKNGVNPVINRDGVYINKGHKTLTTINTAFNRVNVQRTMNVFKKEAEDLGNNFVGSLAIEDTRVEVTDLFTSFINRYINSGKIVDGKAICNDTNNTDQNIDNNELIIDLYVKPVKLYDFVHLTVVVLPQGAEIQ